MPHAIDASVPGSLMLFGEHAVVHGRRALVAAVERRVHVRLVPRRDERVRVQSSVASAETSLGTLALPAPLRFVAAAIAAQRSQLAHGFDLAIESAIDPALGFGSSAAVTVATLAALHHLQPGDADAGELLDESVAVIREVQGRGSGADAAASVHGGFVLYRADPREVRRLAHDHPLTAVYSGVKVPTPEVIAHVARRRAAQPALFEALFDALDACSVAAAHAVEATDWREFAALMDVAQGLMDALGVGAPRLSELVAALRGSPAQGMRGAKISGAGLGDCVIALGPADADVAARLAAIHAAPMDVQVASSGVQVQRIAR